MGSLVVTHPFHPLLGRRLRVLFERRRGGGRVYVCEGGPLGSVTLPEGATDRGVPAAERPLSYELLVDLGAVVAALRESCRPRGDLNKKLGQLSVRQLRARRRRLARALPAVEELLRGTQLSQGRRCGKPGCRCARGELHGPYSYLSLGRERGRGRLVYVPAALVGVVSRRVEASGRIEAALREISEINAELLRRRELD